MSTVPSLDASHYTYRVSWSAEDEEFVATCLEFPSLSWLAGTQVEALQGLVDVVRDTLADMEEQGEEVAVGGSGAGCRAARVGGLIR